MFQKNDPVCLHLRLKDPNHLEYQDQIQQFKIPSNITDHQQAGRFVASNFTPPMNISIIINENNQIIVLNTHHQFSDEGYFKILLNSFLNKQFSDKEPNFTRYTKDRFKIQK